MISVFRDKSSYILLLFSLSFIALIFLSSCSREVSGLYVECNVEGAEVFLNGKRIGTCPLSFAPEAGVYTLTLKKGINADYYHFYEGDIIISEGEPLKVNAKLSRRFTERVIKEMDKRFVLVKGGCFQMGDLFGDGSLDEKPLHEVCLDDYYIGRYELTQAEWQKIMGNNPSRFKCETCPVESVSYNEAHEFISKLKVLTGRNYRLPTEAEWEYAARSGGKREKWAGTSNESKLMEYAWYRGNLDGDTHMVGLKRPNDLGLYDMSGNVEEMVQDRWSEYQSAPQSNPRGPKPVGPFDSVIRGGSYGSEGDEARVSARRGNAIDVGRFYIGLRLARSAAQENQ